MTAKRAILLLAVAGLIASCSYTPTERALEGAPTHHTSQGFRNLYVDDPDKTFFSFLRMRLFDDVNWADHELTAYQVPYQQLDLDAVLSPKQRMQISWLGHSTFLIQYQGLNILTDPIFSERASPNSFAGPKRYTPHVVDYAALPPIDFVIISHNHYDHLDRQTVQMLGNQPYYMVPLGLKDWFTDQGVEDDRVEELDWWQVADPEMTGSLLRVEAQPSQHWSARGLYDRRETLWASWHLTIADQTVWFAGDTGYNPAQFKEIGERNGAVDLALIPIGAYAPRSFMRTYHVDPDEAVLIHQDVRAVRSIGMHWGTFPLTAEEPMDPFYRLGRARALAGLGEEDFGTMRLGQTVMLDQRVPTNIAGSAIAPSSEPDTQATQAAP